MKKNMILLVVLALTALLSGWTRRVWHFVVNNVSETQWGHPLAVRAYVWDGYLVVPECTGCGASFEVLCSDLKAFSMLELPSQC